MLKLLKNIFIGLFIILSIIFMIIETKEVINAVNKGVLLWATRVFPVLFPFYIVSSLALFYGVAEFIGNLLKPVTKFLFNTTSISGFVFVMALISGNPSSAYIISQLYENKEISQNEAQHLLNFCVFVNPLFCIGTIGYAYFHNASIGYIILIAHVFANILIGILLRFKSKYREFETPSKVTSTYKSQLAFGDIITHILQKGTSTMFLIAGFMIFYNLLIVILQSTSIIYYSYQSLSFIFTFLHINYNTYYAFFMGLCEMVIGIDQVIKSNVNLRSTVTMITMLISFGGLSIHSQIQSLLLKVRLKYYPFLLSRLTQMIFSGILAYLIFPIIYKEKTTSTFNPIGYEISEKNSILITILLLLSAFFIIMKIKANTKKVNN